MSLWISGSKCYLCSPLGQDDGDVDEIHNPVGPIEVPVHAVGPVEDAIDDDPVDDIEDNVEQDDDEDEDEDDSEIEEFVEAEDYESMLSKLSKDWLEIELSHNVSKVAANAFWNLSRNSFHQMFRVKELQNVTRKTPSFEHIRRKLHGNIVPPIHMEFGFQNKQTGELTVVEDTKTPRFNPHEFVKLWEVSTVKVILCTVVVFVYLCDELTAS